ncbi:hypothetical protein Q7P37_011645 [Cladosporium fusiforme]
MSTEIPDFTGHVDELRQIFDACRSFDDRTERDNSIDAQPKIIRLIRSIPPQVTQQTPFEAKQRGLDAVIGVAEEILGDKDLIGHEIRKDLPYLSIKSTIKHLLDMLLPEELAALQADGEIPKAILQLRRNAKACSIDMDIDDSIDRLWLEESDREDDTRMAL